MTRTRKPPVDAPAGPERRPGRNGGELVMFAVGDERTVNAAKKGNAVARRNREIRAAEQAEREAEIRQRLQQVRALGKTSLAELADELDGLPDDFLLKLLKAAIAEQAFHILSGTTPIRHNTEAVRVMEGLTKVLAIEAVVSGRAPAPTPGEEDEALVEDRLNRIAEIARR